MVWATKIITDPFHDIKLYYRAPARMFHGCHCSATMARRV